MLGDLDGADAHHRAVRFAADLQQKAPAEAGAVDCSAGGWISPLLLPCLSRLGFVWLSARRHQAPRH